MAYTYIQSTMANILKSATNNDDFIRRIEQATRSGYSWLSHLNEAIMRNDGRMFLKIATNINSTSDGSQQAGAFTASIYRPFIGSVIPRTWGILTAGAPRIPGYETVRVYGSGMAMNGFNNSNNSMNPMTSIPVDPFPLGHYYRLIEPLISSPKHTGEDDPLGSPGNYRYSSKGWGLMLLDPSRDIRKQIRWLGANGQKKVESGEEVKLTNGKDTDLENDESFVIRVKIPHGARRARGNGNGHTSAKLAGKTIYIKERSRGTYGGAAQGYSAGANYRVYGFEKVTSNTNLADNFYACAMIWHALAQSDAQGRISNYINPNNGGIRRNALELCNYIASVVDRVVNRYNNEILPRYSYNTKAFGKPIMVLLAYNDDIGKTDGILSTAASWSTRKNGPENIRKLDQFFDSNGKVTMDDKGITGAASKVGKGENDTDERKDNDTNNSGVSPEDEKKKELANAVGDSLNRLNAQQDPDDAFSGKQSMTGDYSSETEYMHIGQTFADMGEILTGHVFSPYATYGIGGMPASYLPTTDPPAWDGKRAGLGQVYLNHYVRYGQFIAFRPVQPVWSVNLLSIMEPVTDGSITGVLSKITDAIIHNTLSRLEVRTHEYWDQVSRLNRTAIFLMGIQNDFITFETGRIKLGAIDKGEAEKGGVTFGNILNSFPLAGVHGDVWSTIGIAFSNIIGNKSSANSSANYTYGPKMNEDAADHGIVTFMSDGPIEIGESYNNSVGDSAIATAFANITGGTDGVIKEVLRQLSNGGMMPGGDFMQFLAGQYMIPKVWQSGDFRNQYGVQLSFASHSGDPVSVFLNVIYPLNKLLALTIPEAYGGVLLSPWMVNIYSSSSINIEYGMITGIQIQRDMQTINDWGMPTKLKITLNIEDLKPFLWQEKPKFWTMSSKMSGSMTSFLATMVGQNVTTSPKGDRDKFREQIAALNVAEMTDNLGRNFITPVSRMLGRTANRLRDFGYVVNDKLISAGMLYNGVLGRDVYGNAVNHYTGNR